MFFQEAGDRLTRSCNVRLLVNLDGQNVCYPVKGVLTHQRSAVIPTNRTVEVLCEVSNARYILGWIVT